MDMKADLLTISYQTGNGSAYGSALRMMLADAIKTYKQELAPRKAAEFEEIRKNVLVILFKKDPEHAERLAKEVAAREAKDAKGM